MGGANSAFVRLEGGEGEKPTASKGPPAPTMELPAEEAIACNASCFHAAIGPLRQSFALLFDRDTVMPEVLKRPLLWLSLLLSMLSVALRCHAEFEDYEASHMYFAVETAFIASTISMLNTALVFFMTTYVSVGYARWMASWENTQIGYGRINDLNLLVPAYMQAAPKLADDVLRFVNAYHHFVYIATIGHPEEYALQVCVQRRLLTVPEADQLRSAVGSKGMRCLIWATQSVTASGIDAVYARQLTDLIVLLRRSMAYIWSYDDQMLPIAYTQAMNLLVFLMLTAKSCLSGFDYGAAMLDDEGRAEPLRVALVVVTNFGYVLVILILREVSHCIADPFSAYRNGINAEKYLDLLVAGTSKLIKDNKALPVDGKQVRGGS